MRGWAVVGAGALVLAACSSGSPKSSAPTTAAPLATTGPATTGGDGVSDTTTTSPALTIGKTIAVDGFTVQLLTADNDTADSVLKVQAKVTNTLPAPQSFDPPISATSADNTYSGSAKTNPTIAPGATVGVELDINTDQSFETGSAVLIFGSQGHQQATAPLGSSGAFVSDVDLAVTTPAPVTAGLQTFTITKAVVSASDYQGDELNAGTRELILTVTIKNADTQNTFSVGGSDLTVTRGGAALSSGNQKGDDVSAGGTEANIGFHADVDSYGQGGPVTVAFVGVDAQGLNATGKVTLILPPPS